MPPRLAALIREPSADGPGVLLAFWTVVLLVVPLWWGTTSIERLALAGVDRADLARLEPLRFQQEVHVDLLPPDGCFSSSSPAAAAADFPRVCALERALQLALDQALSTTTTTTTTTTTEGEVIIVRADGPEAETSEEFKLVVSTSSTELFSLDYHPGLSPTQIAHFILDLLPSSAASSFSSSSSDAPVPPADSRIVPDAPHLHLVFTLLIEDVSDAGSNDDDDDDDGHLGPTSSSPTGWELKAALAQTVWPFLEGLQGVYSSITVASQIQYHSPLTVTPVRAPPAAGEGEAAEGGWVVKADDVKAFVNSEEWSVGPQAGRAAGGLEDRAELSLMLFVPRPSRRPLGFELERSTTVSRSFLIPQVGSLVIYNPPPLPSSASSPPSRTTTTLISAAQLRPSLAQHVAHLRTLLGLSPLPPAAAAAASSSSSSPFAPPSRAEIASLARLRTSQATRSALASLSALTRLLGSNSQMRLGPTVQASVARAVEALAALASDSPVGQRPSSLLDSALPNARAASQLASRAFYDPSLMGLLYFPAEHKYAVYAPLFAPVGVPLVVAALKELKRRRRARRQQQQGVAAAAANDITPEGEASSLRGAVSNESTSADAAVTAAAAAG